MGYKAEWIERAALADLHAAAPPDLRDALGLQALEVGPGVVSVAAALPASAIVINRVLGLGLGVAASWDMVLDVVQPYRSADVERFFVHRHPDAKPGELVAWLAAAGLEQARGWQKFRHGSARVPAASTDLRMEEVGPALGDAFGRIVAEAFDLGDVARPWLAHLPGRPGWHIFMSFDGDEPAGAGALFVKDGLAWTDFGATVPKYRRRGSQGALLAHRIAFAQARGCREIFTCTGECVPDDPQHSFRNIEKLGFQRDYVRENYAPPKR